MTPSILPSHHPHTPTHTHIHTHTSSLPRMHSVRCPLPRTPRERSLTLRKMSRHWSHLGPTCNWSTSSFFASLSHKTSSLASRRNTLTRNLLCRSVHFPESHYESGTSSSLSWLCLFLLTATGALRQWGPAREGLPQDYSSSHLRQVPRAQSTHTQADQQHFLSVSNNTAGSTLIWGDCFRPQLHHNCQVVARQLIVMHGRPAFVYIYIYVCPVSGTL